MSRSRVTISELPSRSLSDNSKYDAVWRLDPAQREVRLATEEERKAGWYSPHEEYEFRIDAKMEQHAKMHQRNSLAVLGVMFVGAAIYIGIKITGMTGGKKQSYRAYRAYKNKTYKNRK